MITVQRTLTELIEQYQEMLDAGYNPNTIVLNINNIKNNIVTLIRDCKNFNEVANIVANYKDLFDLLGLYKKDS